MHRNHNKTTHLNEVAIDRGNGIFAGTNSYIAEIGGRQLMTVEEFVNKNGFAPRAALSTDPAGFSASGRFVGFSILPAVVSAAPEEHYCATATVWRDFDVSGQDIASIVRRAWPPNSQEPASYTLQ